MKLLFVDDSPTVCAIYRQLLIRHGYEVLLANSLQEALRIARTEHPPLAVVDYFMPGGNGDELTRQLLADATTRDILVVMHSQRSDLIAEVLSAGAIDLIYKEDPEDIFLMRLASLKRFIQVQEESRERLKNLETARAEIRAVELANQAKSRFLATMSHELRTPLNGMLGMVELLARSPLGEKQRRHLAHLRSSGKILLNLINEVLDFARIEEEKLLLEQIPFRLDGLLEELDAQYAILAQAKGLTYHPVTDLGAVSVIADPLRLRQIIGNLLNNALKFTKQGSISLQCARMDLLPPSRELFQFAVVDTGIGLTETQCATIFQPFTQADASTARNYGGAGLGLSIVQKLVALMQGEIQIQSIPEQGTTFRVTLPLTCCESDLPKASHEETIIDQDRFQGFGKRLLVAEDDEVSGIYIEEMLHHLGLEFVHVSDGAEAVRQWQRSKFDLILMDHQMPVMDGLEATRNIRRMEQEQGETLAIPIIALTAFAGTESREASLQAGMNDVLSKPMDPEKLLDLLSRWLETKEEAPSRESLFALLTESDLSMLQRSLGNGFRTVVNAFVDLLPRMLTDIRQAIEQQDCAAFAREAHKLKGRAGALRVAALEQACGELVILGRNSEVTGAMECYTRIARLCDYLLQDLQKAID